MVTVKEISEFIESFAPYKSQCDWDNCGILVGDADKSINKIAFALDLTPETFKGAIEEKADMIITHHPIIFKAQKSFLKGNLAYELAAHGISAISAHTCFDSAEGGVNDVLCELLDIKNFVGVPCEESPVPIARIGEIEPVTAFEFAKKVSNKLGATVRLVDCENVIQKVAVCGGAGMDFLRDVLAMGADAYVTGDISHHEMLEAKELGVSVIAAGHFESENPAMAYLKKYIEDKFPTVETVLLKQSNPVKFICEV